MKIKGIGFDIGGTLVNYNKPLNWSSSYQDAISFMCEKAGLKYEEERFELAKKVLEKYNTRVNPREIEISSNTIFGEIFDLWKENKNKIFDYVYENGINSSIIKYYVAKETEKSNITKEVLKLSL